MTADPVFATPLRVEARAEKHFGLDYWAVKDAGDTTRALFYRFGDAAAFVALANANATPAQPERANEPIELQRAATGHGGRPMTLKECMDAEERRPEVPCTRQLKNALADLLRAYVETMESGDCGNSGDVNKYPEVVAARAALTTVYAQLADGRKCKWCWAEWFLEDGWHTDPNDPDKQYPCERPAAAPTPPRSADTRVGEIRAPLESKAHWKTWPDDIRYLLARIAELERAGAEKDAMLKKCRQSLIHHGYTEGQSIIARIDASIESKGNG